MLHYEFSLAGDGEAILHAIYGGQTDEIKRCPKAENFSESLARGSGPEESLATSEGEV